MLLCGLLHDRQWAARAAPVCSIKQIALPIASSGALAC